MSRTTLYTLNDVAANSSVMGLNDKQKNRPARRLARMYSNLLTNQEF